MDDVMRSWRKPIRRWHVFAGAARSAAAANLSCTSAPSANATQTLHCDNGITIVAENGASFELRIRNRDGHLSIR